MNWDEFALLLRAETTARTGVLQGGGRPGLATVLLVPIAKACVNGVDALRVARLWWSIFPIGAGAALWVLLTRFLPASPRRWTAVATALGLWVLSPDFLAYSIHVRTDQPAIFFGLWGGVALLSSRHALRWAALAGALMGVGLLFSQKLLYVAALVGVLALGRSVLDRDLRWGRDTLRAVLLGGAFLAVVVAYRELARRPAGAPTLVGMSSSLDTFAYYRAAVGWFYYQRMILTLLPQVLTIGAFLIVSLDWLRRRTAAGRLLLIGWAVLALGVGVLLFHAARFPYFYMVLGLFPAVLGALTIGPLFDRWGRNPRARAVLMASIWTPLAALGLVQAAALLRDTQSAQRESLDFINRNFPDEERGFEARGALVCRHDPEPRVRFSQHVITEFLGERGDERAAELIAEFRERPVSFFIPPFADEPYPDEVWSFWRTRYAPYHAHVWLPGVVLNGDHVAPEFEAVTSALFRWIPDASGSASLELDGVLLAPGEAVRLERGVHELRASPGARGRLVMDPGESGDPTEGAFYTPFR